MGSGRIFVVYFTTFELYTYVDRHEIHQNVEVLVVAQAFICKLKYSPIFACTSTLIFMTVHKAQKIGSIQV